MGPRGPCIRPAVVGRIAGTRISSRISISLAGPRDLQQGTRISSKYELIIL